MLGITPGENDSLEDRRLMILARYNMQTPYTDRRLREILNGLLGESGYSLDIDYNNYKIELTFHNIRNIETIYKSLSVIIPANMLYKYIVRVIPESPDIKIMNVPVISKVDTVYPFEADREQESNNDMLFGTYINTNNNISIYPVESDKHQVTNHNLLTSLYTSNDNYITIYPIESDILQKSEDNVYISSYSKVNIKIRGGI